MATRRREQILCLHNAADETISADVDLAQFLNLEMKLVDLLTGIEFAAADGQLSIDVSPYGVY